MYYVFDGTYMGYLTGLFVCFEFKEFDVTPVLQGKVSGTLFETNRIIYTDLEKSNRILKALSKIITKAQVDDFFRIFLSEDSKAWEIGYRILIKIFQGRADILQNYGSSEILYFSQTLKKVSRERHRMKAFVRFKKDNNGIYTSIVEPDFNVLPLITGFFKNRYADQKWLIYDVKRAYGYYYNLEFVSEVALHEDNSTKNSSGISISFDPNEEQVQNLWKSYFKGTNIESRRNMKLHLRHVPKRYWKYLTEKQH